VNARREKGPPERRETLRRRLAAILAEGSYTARELSAILRLSEREVCRHLPHVGRSLRQEGRKLKIEPAVCRSCGYVFRKRERFTRPSRCPECRGESIDSPLFGVAGEGKD
jgi:predicted Zn-ribbon and HTH transcriptional regulator